MSTSTPRPEALVATRYGDLSDFLDFTTCESMHAHDSLAMHAGSSFAVGQVDTEL